MKTQTFHGSCQCGAVKFEAEIDLSQGTGKCNCTSCWKRRWWTARAKPEGFRALQGEAQLDSERGFCRTCGITPYRHVPKSDWNENAYVSVNVAVLDDLDPQQLAEAPVTYYNGRDNDWWHEPKFKSHL